jgi:hypothetical protein
MSLPPDDVIKLADAAEKSLQEEPLRPHEAAKAYAEKVAYQLAQRIHRDGPGLLATLREESRKFIEECRSGARPRYSFLPTVQEVFAKRLWDSWSDEVKKLPEGCGVRIEIWEGYAFLARAQWFVVSADPEKVLEPFWDYIIDPLPNGLLLFDDNGKASNANLIVIAPQSAWLKNYAGAPEEIVREQEAADAAK